MPPINTKNNVTTYAKITSSITAQDLIAENGNRVGLYIYNASSQPLYIRIDATATTTDYTLIIPSNTLYEMPYEYFTDKVSGIWGTADGYAMVTEIADS